MNSSAHSDDCGLASRLARDAGALLLALRARGEYSARALGDEGDRAANEFLLRELANARPNDAVLSEESVDDLTRLHAARVWIIDPLDGTREFREGLDDWAVHVALVEAGAARAAAVSIPMRSEVFSTNDVPREMKAMQRVVISRSRPPEFASRVANALGAALVQVGSAGAKAMMVVRGEAIAYVHDGGMNEWDAAAPVGVALAHGLHVSTLKGEAISFNQRDVVLRDGLIICAKDVVQKVVNAL
ncbi:MAG: 3'(2'),5'-bisphosphate nucleotidase CysQ [Casimicrobium sp.]